MNKPGVMIYFNMIPSPLLPDADRLRLYDAMMEYGRTGKEPEFEGVLAVAWGYVAPVLAQDDMRYEQARNQRSMAGKRSGLARRRKAEEAVFLTDEEAEEAAVEDEPERTERTSVQTRTISYQNTSNQNTSDQYSSEHIRTVQISSEQNNTKQNSCCSSGRMAVPSTTTTTKDFFIAPTVEEVRAFAEGEDLPLDPERFVDYYSANGWLLGKRPMRDWKAAVRNWARKEVAEKPQPEKIVLAPDSPYDVVY